MGKTPGGEGIGPTKCKSGRRSCFWIWMLYGWKGAQDARAALPRVLPEASDGSPGDTGSWTRWVFDLSPPGSFDLLCTPISPTAVLAVPPNSFKMQPTKTTKYFTLQHSHTASLLTASTYILSNLRRLYLGLETALPQTPCCSHRSRQPSSRSQSQTAPKFLFCSFTPHTHFLCALQPHSPNVTQAADRLKTDGLPATSPIQLQATCVSFQHSSSPRCIQFWLSNVQRPTPCLGKHTLKDPST